MQSRMLNPTSTASRPTIDLPLLRVIVARDGGSTASYEFFQPTVSLGRAPGADIRLEAENISRLHATLELREDGLWIRDLGSLNGVYMDGERVRDAIVTPKSVVKIGPFRFKARQEGELPPARTAAPSLRNDEWTRPGDPFTAAVPGEPPVIRGTLETRPEVELPPAVRTPAPTFSRPEPAAARAPAPEPPFARTPVAPATTPVSRAPIAVKKTPPAGPKPGELGDVCPTCHDGALLLWGGEMRCRACWSDENPVPHPAASARVGDVCACCHQGTMLRWEGGLRCRTCGNRGLSSRTERAASVRAGSTCPVCHERSLLTWKGGLRCHGCGQGYR